MERSVGHAKNTPLKGLRFESLEEAQAYLDRWEHSWADTRIHGTTKRQVSTMFAEEKPTLVELPVEPFRVYQFAPRKVNLDGCVEVGAAYYSVPPGCIGRQVRAQWDHEWCGCWTRAPANCCASTASRRADSTASPSRTSQRGRRCPPNNCWSAAARRVRNSAPWPNRCTALRAWWPSPVSRAC